MTSNLGTEYVRRSGTIGFISLSAGPEEQAEQEKIGKALKSTFRPEFLNRIDEIITFSPLSKDQMTEIVDLQIKEVAERLWESGLKVELTSSGRKWLAEKGYDPAFGARPLRRALQKYVESPLSISLLSGEFQAGQTIIVDVDPQSDELVFLPRGEGIPAPIDNLAAQS
jgi:ATP-dependent Clp protease ATP-binding subunit ClpC